MSTTKLKVKPLDKAVEDRKTERAAKIDMAKTAGVTLSNCSNGLVMRVKDLNESIGIFANRRTAEQFCTANGIKIVV